jgi:hypothetical protein
MRAKSNRRSSRRRQRGAVAIIVGFSMVILIFALALVLDVGHLYIAKTELQNAADACALSAVRELGNPGPTVLERATEAGKVAGRANNVDFQSKTVVMSDGDVTFSETLNGEYGRTITRNTRYARCGIHESNPKSIALWFSGLFGVTEVGLGAEAVARLVPGRGCAIPLAICTENPSLENRGLTVGRWYEGRLSAGSTTTGNYDWVRLEGQGARSLSEILAGEGQCDLSLDPVDAQPGVDTGIALAWNTRFGLYAGPYRDMAASPPDRTGYAYTCLDWPQGSPPGETCDPRPHDAFSDFKNKRDITHDPYNPSALGDRKLPGNPSPLPSSEHEKGGYRRTALAPIIKCQDWEPNKKNITVYDYACVLMLSPIADPRTDVRYEFLGVASAYGACTSAGFSGGSGALVPALVR